MRSFDKIEAHGGEASWRSKGRRLQRWASGRSIRDYRDARRMPGFSRGMAKAVFSSGFSWQVIEKKWPGFEAAFDGFDPKKVAAYGDEKIDALLKDTRIVRNGAKIMATIENARFVVATAKAHGSFAQISRQLAGDGSGRTDGSPEEERLAHGRGDGAVLPAL